MQKGTKGSANVQSITCISDSARRTCRKRRFLNRLIAVCALTLLSVLAGLGVFTIYWLWV